MKTKSGRIETWLTGQGAARGDQRLSPALSILWEGRWSIQGQIGSSKRALWQGERNNVLSCPICMGEGGCQDLTSIFSRIQLSF